MDKFEPIVKAIEMVAAASRALAREGGDVKVLWKSLAPLGIALSGVADTFNALVSSSVPGHTSLFSGDEDGGPNLYTRLRLVRDLCSACSYALECRWWESGAGVSEAVPNAVHGPSIGSWSELVRGSNAVAAIRSVEGVSGLLSDLFDAAVIVAQEINTGVGGSEADWGEILRQVRHIRDHFDYAEEMVLDCILPAD